MQELSQEQIENLFRNAIFEIESLSDLLSNKSMVKAFRLLPPECCYTNFKDAVFHFYKMSCEQYSSDIIIQFNAMSEHISRARSDYYSSTLQIMALSFVGVIKGNPNSENVERIKEILFEIRKVLFSNRYSGMSISSGYKRITDCHYQNLLNKIIELFDCLSSDEKNRFLECFEECKREGSEWIQDSQDK